MAKARNPGGDARELVDLVVAYAKQETLEPLKGLGRNVGWGLAGSLCVGVGGIFCGVAALRAMQTETDLFERHNLSYIPYLIVVALLTVAAGIGWVGLGPGKKGR